MKTLPIEHLLEGLHAVVTGGAQGLGLASAQMLAQAGARVCIADLNAETARASAAGLPGRGHFGCACDVADADSRAAAVAHIHQEFSGTVHVLVNNAGIQYHSPAESMDEAQWRRVFDVNIHGVMFMSRDIGAGMLETGGGSIINIGSIASVLAMPKRSVYVATKTAVVGLTRALAVEWAGRGIRVNAVGPGYHWTPLMEDYVNRGALDKERIRKRIPMGRIGTMEDVARAVCFFASPLSEYVTGQFLMVDGGYTVFGAAEDASQ